MKKILKKIGAFIKGLNLHVHLRKLNLTTLLGVLSYLNILAIIPYVFSKNKPFVRFHAKQGLVLLAFIAIGIFTFYLPFIPWVIGIFYFICIIYGIINVFLSRERHLPIIGIIAEKL